MYTLRPEGIGLWKEVKAKMLRVVLGAICLVALLSLTSNVAASTVTMSGTLVGGNVSLSGENHVALVRRYTKQELLTAGDGYALFSKGKIIQFAKESRGVIEDFLSKAESTVTVKVVVSKVEDHNASLIFIKNLR